jgi:hypothetical protein
MRRAPNIWQLPMAPVTVSESVCASAMTDRREWMQVLWLLGLHGLARQVAASCWTLARDVGCPLLEVAAAGTAAARPVTAAEAAHGHASGTKLGVMVGEGLPAFPSATGLPSNGGVLHDGKAASESPHAGPSSSPPPAPALLCLDFARVLVALGAQWVNSSSSSKGSCSGGEGGETCPAKVAVASKPDLAAEQVCARPLDRPSQ